MKRILSIFLLCLVLILSSCAVKNVKTQTSLLPEELYSLITDGKTSYYVSDASIMCWHNENDPQVFFQRPNWLITNLWDDQNYLYFLAVNETQNDFEIQRTTKGEANPVTILKKEDLLAINDSLININGITRPIIQRNTLYFKFSIELYGLKLDTYELKRILDDVGTYLVNNNDLYYIDHANRTFSIYKKDLQTEKTDLLLGNGHYVEKNISTARYKSFILEGNALYYYRSFSDGLYQYENGVETQLVQDSSIHEYSLFFHENTLYYMSGTKLLSYNPVTKKGSLVTEISDYSSPVGFKNNCFFYHADDDSLRYIAITHN